MYYNTEQTQKD